MDRLLTIIRSKRTGLLGLLVFLLGYADTRGWLVTLPHPWPDVLELVGALLAYLGFSPLRPPAPPADEGNVP